MKLLLIPAKRSSLTTVALAVPVAAASSRSVSAIVSATCVAIPVEPLAAPATKLLLIPAKQSSPTTVALAVPAAAASSRSVFSIVFVV
jgi:hypothetical protein